MGKLTLRRADDASITVNYTVNGTTYDFTGCTLFFTVKTVLDSIAADDATDTSAIISKTVTTFTVPTAPVIALSHTDTNVNAGNYVYDIQMKDSTGNITTIDDGTVTVKADVTRRTS
jgi:hypothetical protein